MQYCSRCKKQRTSGGYLWCSTCRAEGAAAVQTRRLAFLAEETCSECGQEWGQLVLGGTSIRNCNHHLDYKRSYNNERYHYARKQGVCVWCFNPAPKADVIGENGYKRKALCEDCSERRDGYAEKKKEKKQASIPPVKKAA